MIIARILHGFVKCTHEVMILTLMFESDSVSVIAIQVEEYPNVTRQLEIEFAVPRPKIVG
jgi:hypothetical protein